MDGNVRIDLRRLQDALGAFLASTEAARKARPGRDCGRIDTTPIVKRKRVAVDIGSAAAPCQHDARVFRRFSFLHSSRNASASPLRKCLSFRVPDPKPGISWGPGLKPLLRIRVVFWHQELLESPHFPHQAFFILENSEFGRRFGRTVPRSRIGLTLLRG